MDDRDAGDQEFEHIPWAHLVADTDDRRTRMLYVGIAVAAAAVIGVLGMRWLSGTEATSLPPATVLAPAPVAPSPAAAPSAVGGVAPAPVPTLPTEADLLATVSGGGESVAMMRAEWFITDYFTVDHDPTTARDVVEAFAPGAALPALPHDTASGTSYVEWARAYRAVPQGGSVYAVHVAFRSIYVEGEAFRRGPVRAAEVLVEVTTDSAAVVDLPSPIGPPRAQSLTPAIRPAGVAPQAAIDAALTHAWLFDADPELVEAAAEGTRWRVVVALSDASGISWPMVIRPGILDSMGVGGAGEPTG